MKDITMKWILSIVLVLLTWSIVTAALQAIHVLDPAEEEQQQSEESLQPPPQTHQPPPVQTANQNQPNTTFFLSVIPVQEPIRDDTPPPNNNSSWSDKSQANPSPRPTNSGNVTPGTASSSIYDTADAHEEDDDDDDEYKKQTEDAAEKPAHDHFSGLTVNNQQRPKSFSVPLSMVTAQMYHHQEQQQQQQEVPVIGLREESNSSTLKASSSVIVDNRDEREPEYHRGKEEFVPSPQLGHWSDEHDFKRLLTENDNVFYPIRAPPPQPASIKSTSFIGSISDSSPPSGEFDKSNKFLNDLPSPKFHSSSVAAGGNHLSSSSLPVSPQSYPRFNDFVVQSQSNNVEGPIDIPHYLQREVEKPFRFPGNNHRTTQFDPSTTQWNLGNEDHRSDVRVQPLLNANPNPAAGTPKHSSHRSTNFIHSSQPHPYTFDFGHDESAAFSKQQQNHGKPALEFYNLNVNEYEKFPTTEHHLHHIPPPSIYPRPHHLQHGGPLQHGPGPWKKIVHVLAAAIPLGLVISALTPHVIYVNPNDTSINFNKLPSTLQKPFPPPPHPHPAFITYYPRWRSLIEGEDGSLAKENSTLTDFLTQLSNSLTDFPGVDLCEDRAFCQVARLGAEKGAAEPHKMLWRIANETTEKQIRKAGIRQIFKAIKEGNCEKIKCKRH